MRAVSDWAGVAPATTPASVASSLIAAGPYSLASARSSAVVLLEFPFVVRQSCYRPRSSKYLILLSSILDFRCCPSATYSTFQL